MVNSLEDHSIPWQSVLEAMPEGTALVDDHGVILYANEEFARITNYTFEELVGTDVMQLVPPRYRHLDHEPRSGPEHHEDTPVEWTNRELTVLRKGGSELSLDFTFAPISLSKEHLALASIRDNSAQRLADRARIEAERHFRLAFEDNMAPMIFADLDNHIIAANNAFCQMVGRERDELLGRGSEHFTYPDDEGISQEFHERILNGELEQLRYVKRYLHKDGRMIVAEISKSPARDEADHILYFIVSARDITEERALTAQLSHQALHDPLTGLANRALFDDRLIQAHSRILRQGGFGALLLLDLDDFKGVNDMLGHLVGDHLLAEAARRLESVTRSSDTLCRFGGDEFIYLAENVGDVSEAERVAARLLQTFDEPFLVDNLSLEQRASLGLVVWDSEDGDIIEIVRGADRALYQAKSQGKGRHVALSPHGHSGPSRDVTLVQELRKALPDRELAMHYQPIVDLSSARVVGFEALMRWRHSERGWVPPNVFIPLAEQSGLILELGSFALCEVISMASSLERSAESDSEPYVTVNLCASQFHDPGFVPMVESEIAKVGLVPERLIFEVPEDVAIREVAKTMNVVERLDRLGVRVALDDFGTGFSSLSHLSLLRPMVIKVDRLFLHPAHERTNGDRLLEAIMAMGNNLGLTMLAKGIETPAQLERLRNLNCSLGQGFLFSPAVPREDAIRLMDQVLGT